MRILVVTGHLDPTGEHPWLVDDLVAELAAAGAEVDVLSADPRRRPGAGRRADLPYRLTELAPPGWTFRPLPLLGARGAALLRRAWCGVRLLRHGRGAAQRTPYDGVIQFSIGALNAGVPARLRRSGAARRSLFILWDFFPVHQLEIGHVPAIPGLVQAMRRLERDAIGASDLVAVMSERNREYLDHYHSLSVPTFVLPPWSTSGVDAPRPVKRDEFTVVFGGQLTAGRDLATMVTLAEQLARDEAGRAVRLLIVGDGPARGEIEQQIRDAGLVNIALAGRLPREDYRALAASCHVGLSITSASVTVPSFPSKIPEFLGLGLPVVAATEATTDAGEVVQSLGVGLAARTDDIDSITTAVLALLQEHHDGRLRARSDRAQAVWRDQFSASSAAQEILRRLGQD